MVFIAMTCLTQIARIGNPATARVTRPGVDRRTTIHFIIKYSTVMIIAVMPMSLMSILFPEQILKVIFSPEYISAATSLRVLGFYMLVFSAGLVASQYVISARMEKQYFLIVIVGGVLGLMLCLVMIPMMGEIGAAYSLLLSHSLVITCYWIITVWHVNKFS
jgi:O-antigen/teichoic acid export membrane protein